MTVVLNGLSNGTEVGTPASPSTGSDASSTQAQRDDGQRSQTSSEVNVLNGLLQDLSKERSGSPADKTFNAIKQYAKQQGWKGEEATLLPLIVDRMVRSGIPSAVIIDFVDALASARDQRLSSLVATATSFHGYPERYILALQRLIGPSSNDLKKELPAWQREQILDQYKRDPERAVSSLYSMYGSMSTKDTHPKNREVFKSLSDQYTKLLIDSKKVDGSHIWLAWRTKRTGDTEGHEALVQAILSADNVTEFLQEHTDPTDASITKEFVERDLKGYQRIPLNKKADIEKIVQNVTDGKASKPSQGDFLDRKIMAEFEPGVREVGIALPPGLTTEMIDEILDGSEVPSAFVKPKIITLLNQVSTKFPTTLATEEGKKIAADEEVFEFHKFVAESSALSESLMGEESSLTQYADLKKLSAAVSLIALSHSDVRENSLGYRFTLLSNVVEEFADKGIDATSRALLKIPIIAERLRQIAHDTPRDAKWSRTWSEDIEKILSQ